MKIIIASTSKLLVIFYNTTRLSLVCDTSYEYQHLLTLLGIIYLNLCS